MKNKIIILFANPYRMQDEHGGVKEGVSINYIYGESLEPVNNPNGSKGQRSAKASLPIQLQNKLLSVPALYDGSFEMSVGTDGKPSFKLTDVDYISDVTVTLKKA